MKGIKKHLYSAIYTDGYEENYIYVIRADNKKEAEGILTRKLKLISKKYMSLFNCYDPNKYETKLIPASKSIHQLF